MDDTDFSTRSSAIEAMGNIQDADCVLALTTIYYEENKIFSGPAFNALLNLMPFAVQVLCTSLIDGTILEQTAAAYTLGGLGSKDAVSSLRDVLSNTLEDTTLRSQVVIALGEIGGDAAIDALIQAKSDEDDSIRIDVLRALAMNGINFSPIEPLIDQDYLYSWGIEYAEHLEMMKHIENLENKEI